MSSLERLAGFLIAGGLTLLVAGSCFFSEPMLKPHSLSFLAVLQRFIVPGMLAALWGLAYLAYLYRKRSEQAESALKELNTALESSHQLVDTLTNTDLLTGALNRRGLEKFIAEDVRRAANSGLPIIALILDLDGFKQINERFGQDAGDAVLKEIASRLKKSCRRSDRIGRIVSDQFLILLKDTTAKDAELVAARTREAVSHPPIGVGTAEATITAAVGMSILPDDVSTLEDVLTLTKPSLHKAKVANRLKVT